MYTESHNIYDNPAKTFLELYKAHHSGKALSAAAIPLYVDWIETPLGQMISIADERALYVLEFIDRKNMSGQIARLMRYHGREIKLGRTVISDQIRAELGAYFQGDLRDFKTPITLSGTTFQSQVWRALMDIPYGQTRSYAQLAQDIGSEKAVRAVASSNARNALAIIIPCHRVISKSGAMAGYAGGVGRKVKLLTLEGAITA